jgi:para-aminobenzoate synthetase component 1
MRPLLQKFSTALTPDSIVERLSGQHGIVLLHSRPGEMAQARYSYVAARPFLTFRSFGSRCELAADNRFEVQFGNPWSVLDSLLSRYELLDELDLPFPLGGCFGYWGYDLKDFVEPELRHRAVNELELPDCCVGFYSSLVVFDHVLARSWIIATGLAADGSRLDARVEEEVRFWQRLAEDEESGARARCLRVAEMRRTNRGRLQEAHGGGRATLPGYHGVSSNLTRDEFISRVERAQRYIRAGDIYQVNLSQRLSVEHPCSAWDLYRRLGAVSPAPFSAYLDSGDFQIVSASPELFLRMSGAQILTRPIKGTRPRSPDATRDAQLTYELQTSPKEMAELVMITDLLRNDLGKVCEYGSVHVPELVRLERYPQVQHLVSTVEGRLRHNTTHLQALAACFPGGSITGAPKFRAMEIIDELEPARRGPYTGALGYLGFNRESQLSIIIRTALCSGSSTYFHVGAGIVADSIPAAEYEETLAKARGLMEALHYSIRIPLKAPQ